MADRLVVFAKWIRREEWPSVACPVCGKGGLAVEKIETRESEQSARTRGHEAWEPEWIMGVFNGTLRCSSIKCSEIVSMIGDYKVSEELDDKGRWCGEYTELFQLKFTLPAIMIIDVPDDAPTEVKKAVAAASQVLWADPSAAANRLRFAVEALLTSKKVARYRNSNGKRHRLTTHERIIAFKKTDAESGEALEAVKWIGNTGSHDANLTVYDVLEGSEMFGYALQLIYDRTNGQLRRRIRAINKAKGIPKKRQGS